MVPVSLSCKAQARSLGINPARTTDDFPLPEGPSTARKRVAFNFSTKRWISPLRPKKNSTWSSLKVCRPRYGQMSARASIGVSGPGATPLIALIRSCKPRESSMPFRRSIQVRVLKNGGQARGIEWFGNSRQEDQKQAENTILGGTIEGYVQFL